jgi:hypothetical protein
MLSSTGALTHNKGVFVHEEASECSLCHPLFIQNSLHN